PRRTVTAPLRDIRDAVHYVVNWAISAESGLAVHSISDIHAVGHRVVHGGERFTQPVLITGDPLPAIEERIQLATLPNPGSIKGRVAARELFGPGLPQVAVFDTAFHQTLPERAYLYAVPYQFYRRYKVRRYGFHGTSQRYIAYRYRQLRGIERE